MGCCSYRWPRKTSWQVNLKEAAQLYRLWGKRQEHVITIPATSHCLSFPLWSCKKKKIIQNENFKIFILLHRILVVAHRVFSCSMWDLVLWPGIEPRPPALGALSLSHWTTREVPKMKILIWSLVKAFLTQRQNSDPTFP